MHLVQPNRHPAGQQLDSYYSTKILEMCLCKWIMKYCPTLKGLTAENKLSFCHSQQITSFLDASEKKAYNCEDNSFIKSRVGES